MALTDIVSNLGGTAQDALNTYLGTGTEYESSGAPTGGYTIAPGGAIPGLEAPNISIEPAQPSTSLLPTSIDPMWVWVGVGVGVFLIMMKK